MTREIDGIIGFARAFDPSVIVTSTNGGKHAAHSFHYEPGTESSTGVKGLAADFDFIGAKRAERRLALARHFAGIAPRLYELFYTPLKFSVKDGSVKAFTIPDHSDHLHVAVRKGVFLTPLPGTSPIPKPPPVRSEPQKDEDDMIQYEFEDGAIISANAKGEVFCPEIEGRPTAKHYGGMTNLKDDAKRGFEKIVAIVGLDRENSQAGYRLIDQRWTKDGFKFEPGVEKYFR